MGNVVKKIAMFNVPAFAVAFLTAVAFYSGGILNSTHPNGKYATAEKSAVIMQAVFDRQGASEDQLKAEISLPVLAVLKKYADLGYVVIDTGKDENGNMTVAALPEGATDITTELRAAITKKAAPVPAH